jgi:hypothetical protein
LFTTINIQSQAVPTVSGLQRQYIQTKSGSAKLETSQTNCFKQHTGKTSQTKRKEKLKSGNNRHTGHGSITLVTSNLKPNNKLAANWH